MKPYIASHLKDMNRKVIYRLMEEKEVLSRTDIARETGISAPTVMKVASYLIEKGILIESGEGQTALGRKPMMLMFNPDAAYAIGVDIRVGHVMIGLLDLKGNIIDMFREESENGFLPYFEHQIGSSIHNWLDRLGIDRAKILGAGIAIPGAIDSQRNIVHFAPLIGIHEKTDLSSLVQKLSAELGMPVLIENDVNAAAVGEFSARKVGAGGDLVYMTVGNGVGAGIIIEGKLYKGARFSAGEVGYMVFDPQFQTSKTDAGWLEERLDYGTLSRRLAAAGKAENPERLEEMADHAADYVAICIANISSVLDIRTFVLGGDLAEALGVPFFRKLQELSSRLCLNETIVERQLCPKPHIAGMASIVRNEMLEQMLAD